jgi:hypothetical protein
MAKSRMDAEIREKLVGHSIGIARHYIRYSQQKMLQEYIKAVDLLTINEENRLNKKVRDLTKKQDVIRIMKQRHEQEMKAIHEQMNQIMSMIQQNPQLAYIKPEVLTKKRLNGI